MAVHIDREALKGTDEIEGVRVGIYTPCGLCAFDAFAFQLVCTVIEVDTLRTKGIFLGVRAGG